MPKKSDITIRDFQPSDLDSVRHLIHSTIDACYSDVYPKEAVKFFKNWHRNEHVLKDAKEGYTIVMEDDGRIIATATLVADEIKRLFVAPAHQRNGLGKILTDKLEEKAISQGIPLVRLDASLPSKQFYDTLGYKTTKETSLQLENNKKLHYYKMQKTLKTK